MADTIQPLPLSDHMNPLTNIILTAALIVAGRLDTEVLRVAFTKLVDTWPKLGTRMAKGKNGLFEYHTPAAFSEERPPFMFTVTEQIDRQCPDIPKRTLGSQAEMSTYQYLFRSKDCPGVMLDWLKQKDAPTVRIHITAFSDATCIGFTIPHIFGDVSGVSVIMRAWCSILAGRESELPLFITKDPIAHIGGPYPSSKKERKAFYADMQGGYHIAGFWEKVRYYAPLVKEFILHSKEETRLVFLPRKTLEKLRQVALAELQDEKEAWVSENDIIIALIIKLSNLHRKTHDKTPYAVAMAANFRNLLPELKDPSKAYLHNSVTYFVCPPMASGSLPDRSLGDIGRHIRGTIVAQRPLTQSSKQLTVYREMCKRGDYPAYVPGNGRSYSTTSWLAGRWTDLDFSPAVVETGSIDSASAEKPKGGVLGDPGKIIFSGGSANIPKMPRRFWAIVMSRQPDDAAGEGGVWFEMAARVEFWPKIDECLRSL